MTGGRSRVAPATVARALASCILLVSCRRSTVDASADAGQAAREDAAALATCTAEDRTAAPPGVDEVEVGDAIVDASGVLAGVIARHKGARTHAVWGVSRDLARSELFPLGEARGDEPPPKPVRSLRGPLAAFYRSSRPRRLVLAPVEQPKDAGPRAFLDLEVQADESYAFDVAVAGDVALVAWDEDAPSRDTGLVKVATVDIGAAPEQPDGSARGLRVVSDPASDAESPRVVAREGGGFFVAWLARRTVDVKDAGHAAALEAPGERRAFTWVELAVVDSRGNAIMSARRVTPATGHAAEIELSSADGGVMVHVQDEEARADGAGMRIYKVFVAATGAAGAPVDVVPDGVGRAAMALLGTAARPWIAYTDTVEHAFLAGPSGGPRAAVPAFDPGRPLVDEKGVIFGLHFSATGQAAPRIRRYRCPDVGE